MGIGEKADRLRLMGGYNRLFQWILRSLIPLGLTFWYFGVTLLWLIVPIVLSLLWLVTLSCWFSPLFRYTALGAVKVISRLRTQVTRSRVILALILFVAYSAAEQPPKFLSLSEILQAFSSADSALGALRSTFAAFAEAVRSLDTDLPLKAVAVTLLVLAAHWMIWSRPRMAIYSFQNQTGEAIDQLVGGLSSHLEDGLIRLSQLFQVIDEAQPNQSANMIQPQIRVEGTAKDLQDLKGEISLGKLSVPINTVARMLRRLTRGPSLNGSLARYGDDLVLIAELSGPSQKSWQVRRRLSSGGNLPPKNEQSDQAVILEMADELLYRVFAEQAFVGSPKWRAVRRYSRGLIHYRNTLRSPKDRTVNLRKAERQFRKALEEDEQFSICHYNLGIVFRDLKVPKETEYAAFTLAAKMDPQSANAFHALASAAWDLERWEECIQHCDRIIDINCNDPRAWDMKGFALRNLKERQLGYRMEVGQHQHLPFWRGIAKLRSVAAALSWSQLSQAVLKGRRIQEVSAIAVTCTHNLAVAQAFLENYRASQRSYRQAISLDPSAYNTITMMGATFEKDEQWSKAAITFERALGIRNEPDLWTLLARSKAHLLCESGMHLKRKFSKKLSDALRQDFQGILNSLRRGLEGAATASVFTLEQFMEALEILNRLQEESQGAARSVLEAKDIKHELQSFNQYREWLYLNIVRKRLERNNFKKAKKQSRKARQLFRGSQFWQQAYDASKKVEDLWLNHREQDSLRERKKVIERLRDRDVLIQLQRKSEESPMEYRLRLYGLLFDLAADRKNKDRFWLFEYAKFAWMKDLVAAQASPGALASPPATRTALPKMAKVEKWIRRTIEERSKPRHPVEILKRFPRYLLVEACLIQEKYGQALVEAQYAAQNSLGDPEAHHLLAKVLWSIKEQSQALSEWEICLSQEPDSEILAQIAQSLNPLEIGGIGDASQEGLLRRCARLIDRIHSLLESRPQSLKDALERTGWQHRSLIHERLGVVYFLLEEPERAYRYLAIADALRRPHGQPLSEDVQAFLKEEAARQAGQNPKVLRLLKFLPGAPPGDSLV